jgi:hypothetical protein
MIYLKIVYYIVINYICLIEIPDFSKSKYWGGFKTQYNPHKNV